MKMKKILPLSIALALILGAGCSKKAADSAMRNGIIAQTAMPEASDSAFSDFQTSGKGFSGTGYNGGKESSTTASSQSQAVERKIIRTGYMNIEVESLAETMSRITAMVQSMGGYISSTTEDARYLSCVVRIPSSQFERAMNETSGLGKLKSKDISTSDVTEEYYDLQTRLDTKLILQERYQTYLKEAKTVEDLFKVERTLNDVTSEVESMKGKLNRMNSEIDFSTINIRANLPPNQTEQGYSLPDTGGMFRGFLGSCAGFFNGILFVLLYIVVFGVPIVLLIALFWWLCFGKIGLVRKLFNKVNAKND